MNKVVHRADSRGHAEHGWLHSRHSFSFASYYNAQRMGFGLLRVLNDDLVEPGAGFPTHPHQDMEIVSIPLSGSLRHQDSMDNVHVIRVGEVQIMSAGTGITHSEYNGSDSEPVNFLQIWVQPKQLGIEPRYAQKEFAKDDRHNRWQSLIATDGRDGAMQLNQDAWFSMVDLDAGKSVAYPLHRPDTGVYVFVISGQLELAGESLQQRDAIGISGVKSVELAAATDGDDVTTVLCIEVPMS